MPLQNLFVDRRARKYIRESIDSAKEIGRGMCYCCGNSAPLLESFGVGVCESCAEKSYQIADDYDTVFENSDDKNILDYIKEGYADIDIQKIETEAKNNFNGSIPNLMKSYGLKVHKDYNDRWDKGRIFFYDTDLKSGKTKINKFLIDFNGKFISRSGYDKLVPDADGTSAPNPFGASTGTSSSPTRPSNSSVNKSASSTKVVQAVQTGYVTGNMDHFSIQVGNDEIELKKVSNGYSVAFRGSEIPLSLNATDLDAAVEEIKEVLSDNPGILFPAFDGYKKEKGYTPNSSSVYSFGVDKESFGKTMFSMYVIYNGVAHKTSRVNISSRALSNISILNKELTDYMEERMSKDYPFFSSKNSKIKTPVGVATFDMVGIEQNNGKIEFVIDFNFDKYYERLRLPSDVTDLKDIEKCKKYFTALILTRLSEVIKGFDDPSIKINDTSYVVKAVKNRDGSAFDVQADFNQDLFFDNQSISFEIKVRDLKSGVTSNGHIISITNSNKSLQDILTAEGLKIYKSEFVDSGASKAITISAQKKFKSPGKREAFFSKVADIFTQKVVKDYRVKDLDDCEVSLSFSLGKDQRPMDIRIEVCDPYSDIADDSRELASTIKLDKELDFLKFGKADPVMKDGPKVYYDVTNVDKFIEFTQLHLLEGMMLEAFGLTPISENSHRKSISALR